MIKLDSTNVKLSLTSDNDCFARSCVVSKDECIPEDHTSLTRPSKIMTLTTLDTLLYMSMSQQYVDEDNIQAKQPSTTSDRACH